MLSKRGQGGGGEYFQNGDYLVYGYTYTMQKIFFILPTTTSLMADVNILF